MQNLAIITVKSAVSASRDQTRRFKHHFHLLRNEGKFTYRYLELIDRSLTIPDQSVWSIMTPFIVPNPV